MTNAKPSKSARKRELQVLGELVDALLDLKDSERHKLELDDKLLDAIAAAQRIKSHEALRRQKRFIAKCLRDTDIGALRAALFEFGAAERNEKRLFAQAEKWRDRLLDEGGDGVDALAAHADIDRDALERLLAELAGTVDERREKFLKKQLFREIHRFLVTGSGAG